MDFQTKSLVIETFGSLMIFIKKYPRGYALNWSKVVVTPPPQTNGLNKRLNGVLGQLLKRYCFVNRLNWNLKLPLLELTYNSTPHAAIKTSPFLVDSGYEPFTPSF